MKKMKFILSSIIPVMPLMFVSCTNNEIVKKDLKIELNKKVDKWNVFLNQEYIQAILKTVFRNNELEKQKYIESQFELDQNYLDSIKWAFNYASANIMQYGYDGSLFSTNDKPEILKQSESFLNKLFQDNWLFWLYYFNQTKFIYYPNYGAYESDPQNLDITARENSKKLGSFYSPSSNKISQYVKQLYEKSDSYKVFKFYLLTQEGFIMRVDVSFYKPNDEKYIPTVEAFRHIITMPELISDPIKLKNFELIKYVNYCEGYSESTNNRTQSIIFKDEYGGRILRYCIYSVK